MKSILFALCALILVINSSNSFSTPETTSKTASSEIRTSDKIEQVQNYSVSNSQSHENGWRDVIKDPTAVFTFLIAIFTLWLVLETANSNKRSLRAYVFADNASLWEGSLLSPPQPARINIPGAVIIIKNSGQTPAYKVISWAQIAVIEPINEYTLVVPALENIHSNTMGSDGTFSKSIWFSRALTANEIADISLGVRAIYLYGRIEYHDVFGRKFHSNFRVSYVGQFPPAPGVSFWFCEQGNDAV